MKYLALPAMFLIFTSSAYAGCISTECEKKLMQINEASERGYSKAGIVAAIAMLDNENALYNPAKAIKYLTKAHRNNYGAATWLLSDLYREGTVVTKDLDRASFLHSLALERGFSDKFGETLKSKENFEAIINSSDVLPNDSHSNRDYFAGNRDNSLTAHIVGPKGPTTAQARTPVRR